MRKRRLRFGKLTAQIRKDKRAFTVFIILRACVIAALVLSALRGDYESVFLCVLTLFLFMLPAFVEKNFNIELPTTLEIVILVFIFAAEILGELSNFFLRFKGWDIMLHTTNGFLCAAFGFALVDIFNRNKKFKFELSPMFLSVVAFCFSMTIGVLWEFFEFAGDQILFTDMQKDTVIHSIYSVALDPTNTNKMVVINDIKDVMVNGQSLNIGGYLDIGLIDTMKDLLVNFVGAVVFSIIGYFYVKNRGEGSFASQFIPTVYDEEEHTP